MKQGWPVNEELFTGDTLSTLEIDTVLVEYDGPKVALWKGANDVLALGVVADEDETSVRWLLASTERVELDGMLLGALSVRDALTKHDALVCDVERDGKPTAAWRADWSRIPEDFLPSRGALLPSAVRQQFLTSPAADRGHSMRIASVASPASHKLEFTEYANVLTAHQSLWTAGAQALSDKDGRHRGSVKKYIKQRSVMYASAEHAGSFEVEIFPADKDTFAQVGDLVQRITRASDDAEALVNLLRPLQRRFAMAYAKYLDVIDKRGLNVLTRWDGSATFMGTGTARRVRLAVLEAQSMGDDGEEFTLVGQFVSFNKNDRKFKFYDSEAEEEVDGVVEPDLELDDVKVGATTYKIEVTAFPDLQGAEEALILTALVEHDPQAPLKLTPSP